MVWTLSNIDCKQLVQLFRYEVNSLLVLLHKNAFSGFPFSTTCCAVSSYYLWWKTIMKFAQVSRRRLSGVPLFVHEWVCQIVVQTMLDTHRCQRAWTWPAKIVEFVGWYDRIIEMGTNLTLQPLLRVTDNQPVIASVTLGIVTKAGYFLRHRWTFRMLRNGTLLPLQLQISFFFFFI